MYYPFLRARQFELIALRELSIERELQGFVIPIIEPVKESVNNLKIASDVFQKEGQTAYLIANPLVGNRSGDDSHYLDLLKEFPDGVFKLAFHFIDNADYIIRSIRQYELSDCMILCGSDIDISNLNFKELVSQAEISAVCVQSPERNRLLHRFLKGLDKLYIRFDDLFDKQPNNSAYLDIFEHRFSEEHLYFASEGFSGFGDFTVLPSEYIDGGSTPRAVVIHLTYLRGGEFDIWIRHFTSFTNQSTANVQGKFAEAAEKAIRFCMGKGLNNSAIRELTEYFNSGHYPGLGTIKKISIKNHILVIVDFLRTI